MQQRVPAAKMRAMEEKSRQLSQEAEKTAEAVVQAVGESAAAEERLRQQQQQHRPYREQAGNEKKREELPCWYHNEEGFCRKGDDCDYSHNKDDKEDEVQPGEEDRGRGAARQPRQRRQPPRQKHKYQPTRQEICAAYYKDYVKPQEATYYKGYIKKQSGQAPYRYFIKCYEVTERYGRDASVSAEEEVKINQVVHFTLEERDVGTSQPSLEAEIYDTGEVKFVSGGAKNTVCWYYTQHGSCKKGDDCDYIHEREEVAAERPRRSRSPTPQSRKLFRGVVKKKSNAYPYKYFIKCKEVTEIYGKDASLDVNEFAEVGDEITFRCVEEEIGPRTSSWTTLKAKRSW